MYVYDMYNMCFLQPEMDQITQQGTPPYYHDDAHQSGGGFKKLWQKRRGFFFRHPVGGGSAFSHGRACRRRRRFHSHTSSPNGKASPGKRTQTITTAVCASKSYSTVLFSRRHPAHTPSEQCPCRSFILRGERYKLLLSQLVIYMWSHKSRHRNTTLCILLIDDDVEKS